MAKFCTSDLAILSHLAVLMHGRNNVGYVNWSSAQKLLANQRVT